MRLDDPILSAYDVFLLLMVQFQSSVDVTHIIWISKPLELWEMKETIPRYSIITTERETKRNGRNTQAQDINFWILLILSLLQRSIVGNSFWSVPLSIPHGILFMKSLILLKNQIHFYAQKCMKLSWMIKVKSIKTEQILYFYGPHASTDRRLWF